MQLHLATMVLGALSFLIPLVWQIKIRLTEPTGSLQAAARSRHMTVENGHRQGKKRSRSKAATKKAAKRKQSPAPAVDQVTGWRLSPFRLLLFAGVFHPELAGDAKQPPVRGRGRHDHGLELWRMGRVRPAAPACEQTERARSRRSAYPVWSLSVRSCWFSSGSGSGLFYKMTGEGRVISLGEDPLFFPHEAARFAGQPGMPDRFLSFHNGHASLFEYYHGPDRKVYTDPRLEVAGADLFKRYIDLENLLKKDLPGWEAQLNEMGRPVILVDHEHNWEIGATLFRSAHWRCVWFDAIAAVFVHDSNASIVRANAVDFAARHFRPDPSAESRSVAELTASAKAFRSYAPAVAPPGGELGRPFFWLGLDDARRLLRRVPDSFDAWKLLGQIELFRELSRPSPARGFALRLIRSSICRWSVRPMRCGVLRNWRLATSRR